MTACVELNGSESVAFNLEIQSDANFDDSLSLAHRCVATGIKADRSLIVTGYNNIVSDSSFGYFSDLTSDGTLISNCRFVALDLNGDYHRLVGVSAAGALRVYGDDCVVLAYRTSSTVLIDVGAARTRYGANEGTLTDNSTTTIYLDNDMIGTGDITSLVVKDIVFTKSALTDAYTGTKRIYTKAARTITGCFASVDGVPVTNPAVFDVHKDGTTIYTTQANRPDVAAAAYVGDLEVPNVTAWAAGSYLTVDVDTASSATGLTLTVQYTES